MLFGDNEGTAFDTGDQFFSIHGDSNGVVARDGLVIVQKLSFQTTGDEGDLFRLQTEHDVPAALDDLHRLVRIAADLAHFVKRRCGYDKLAGSF